MSIKTLVSSSYDQIRAVIFLLTFLSSFANGAELILSKDVNQVRLKYHWSIYQGENAEAQHPLELLFEEDRWHTLTQTNRGYSQQAQWLKIAITNTDHDEPNWYIKFQENAIDSIGYWVFSMTNRCKKAKLAVSFRFNHEVHLKTK